MLCKHPQQFLAVALFPAVATHFKHLLSVICSFGVVCRADQPKRIVRLNQANGVFGGSSTYPLQIGIFKFSPVEEIIKRTVLAVRLV